VRNYVHPAVWALDRTNPLKFTKGVYGVVDEVVDVGNSWLLHRVEKDLLKGYEEGRKEKGSACRASCPIITSCAMCILLGT
jgi:hypothetical protein